MNIIKIFLSIIIRVLLGGDTYFLSFLVLFLLVGCNKSSDDWVKYNIDIDGNVYSYKKVNIDKDIVQVWEKVVCSDKGREKEIQDRIKNGLSTEGYDKILHTQFLYEIDCKKQKKHILSMIQYDTNGKVLYSVDIDKSGWSYISPDSYEETILKQVCK